MSHLNRFNIYLSSALVLALVCGCQTEETKRNKQLSTLRLHLEVNPDGTERIESVPVYRERPYMVSIEKAAFLTEGNLTEAKVIDVVGGFSISLKFDRQGTWLLDQYTTANRGRHIAIFSQWTPKPGEKLNPGRWLIALQVTQRITDGLLNFTPDATREEADQIVLGLNHVAKKLHGTPQSNW